MIFKEVKWTPKTKATHEEGPQEDLWEDGEIGLSEVQDKIIYNTLDGGDWILVRRIDG